MRSSPSVLFLKAIFLALLFFSRISPAQIQTIGPGPIRYPNASSTERYPLTGVVVDAATGEPIRHALVQVSIEKMHSVFTGDQGQFEFPKLPAGTMVLSIVKPGYANVRGFSSRAMRPLMVTVGPNAQPVIVKLPRQAEVFGTITDSNGNTIENVSVRLMRVQVEEGVRKRVQINQSQADEEGNYHFYDLVDGDYILSAGPSWRDLNDPFAPGVVPFEYYAQTFFPAATDVATAATFHLASGKNQQIDLSLSTGRTSIVTVSVAGGNPQSTTVNFLNASGQDVTVLQRHVTREGFIARVAAGPVLIKARGNDGQGGMLYGETTIDASSDVKDVHIQLDHIQIPITYEYQNVTGAQVPLLQPPQLRLISLDPVHPDAWAQTTGTPGNWNYSFTNIEPGRYRVEVPSNDWFADAITSGNVNLKTDPLVVTPGNSQPIEVTLRNDSAQLMIKVEGADPASQSQIMTVVVPEGGGRPRQNTVYSPNQSPVLSLPPGHYTVYAFQDFDDLAFADPEVMKDFARFAQTVELQSKQRAEVTAHVIRKSAQ